MPGARSNSPLPTRTVVLPVHSSAISLAKSSRLSPFTDSTLTTKFVSLQLPKPQSSLSVIEISTVHRPASRSTRSVFVPLPEIEMGSTGIGVGVAVGTGVGVAVGVGVLVGVGVAVGTGIGVAVGVGVAVGSGTAVADGIGVFVALGVEVGVGAIRVTGDSNSASWVGVRVAMGSDSPQATRRISKPTIRSAFCMGTPHNNSNLHNGVPLSTFATRQLSPPTEGFPRLPASSSWEGR